MIEKPPPVEQLTAPGLFTCHSTTGLHLVQSHQKIRKLKRAFLPAIKQQKNLVYATKIALLAQLIQMKCKKNCQTQTQAPLQKFDQHIRMIRVFC